MRKPILSILAGMAITFVAGREVAAGAGAGPEGNYQRGGGGGGGAAQSMGGGSFARPVARSAPEFGGGGFSGGRVPSAGFNSAPRSPSGYEGGQVRPSAPAYSRTSIPTFQGNRINSGGVRPGQSGAAAGGGFINIPGGGGANSTRPATVLDHRTIGVGPGLATGPRLTRSLGAAPGSPIGVGTMPAIQQYLQRRGQNLQAWSSSRELGLNRLHAQNSPRIGEFQRDRGAQWTELNGHQADRVRMAREQGADFQSYRRDLWRYRYNRADEIRDRLRNGFDDLFTHDWWQRHHGGNFLLADYSPWWWWNPCPWNTLTGFSDFGWDTPVYYDYGANVIDDGGDSDVYIDGQDWGSSAAYAQQAIQLANPLVPPDEPTPLQSSGQPGEWQPFGVFALTQQEKGDAIMFFQLAINKDGLIGGAYTNVLTDDSAPVSGAVDRATQKAAWHVGDKTNTVYEVGVANLTQDVAPVLVHFDTQSTQTWLLVRLPSPDLPTVPATINAPAQQ